MLLGLLQACKGHFLCFWGCCKLARVTFCTFGALAGLQGSLLSVVGAVAGLQGSLFVLLGLLQACKGYFLCFWSSCRLARVTFCAFEALAGLQGSLLSVVGAVAS